MHENEAEEETHFIEMVSNKTRFETGTKQLGYGPLRLLCQVKVDEVKGVKELKRNTGKPRRGMDGQNWRGLRWIAFG